ncbi:tRNA methyltransferase 10 homolog A [Rhopalosiphum padi]|uniref:tRNA methyltransferase 10 homolog A n=1 Tax=Rhopalosiphum padi TaxID=40932 RepID=UPI00298E9909|nr:tRNA methyltransferase 10 homolog A [Rhopalosiphum padi]XP_060833545.1 tRNA methyltransferase 10 homolog A [Rhopalosiphum padi]XP_060833546.1 tRNA methyltransferase 10 homolog A [Rhopalosiphum padi]
MNESPETVLIKPNHDTDAGTAKETVLNEIGKRSLDESEDVCESNHKICKLEEEKNAGQSTLSKRQLKKIQKEQIWMEKKAIRKELNKEKKVEKKKLKAQMRELGVEVSKVKRNKMADSTCKQRIVLDMSYDNLMSDKDLCKCSNQILRCYGLNRRMDNPMQLHICSYEGKIKEIMAKHNGSEFWDLKYLEDSFDKVFQKEEIVYLTSDSMNVLESIDENKVYIIGGLVDHNSCKGASLKIANDLGIAHARLPIDEHINMQTRKILTINHVFEIISKVVSGISWKEALISTLPKRKMFSVIDEEDLLEYDNCSIDYKSKLEIECPEVEKNENLVEENVSLEN